MVVVRLKGGLGNQLFQYAFGRALCERAKQSLVLDTSYFDSSNPGETPRDYRLHHYAIAADVGVPSGVKKVLKLGRKRRGIRSRVVRSLFNVHINNEKSFEYAQTPPPEGYGVWQYDGYWQSPLYFDDIRPILLEELSPRLAPQGENARLLDEMRGCNAISVHIRRGDYVTSAKTQEFHGLCGLEYYKAAMALMAEQVEAPRFYVFSDDIAWARDNIVAPCPVVFVGHNDDAAAYEDLRLMSACRHHIVANSSFSWWGAWLNPYEQKKVIAPQRWFLDASVNCKDLVPASWSRM